MIIRSFVLALILVASAQAESVRFAWDHVTTDAAGNPVQGLIGYKLYISTTQGSYKFPQAYISKAQNTVSVNFSSPGTRFAVVRAYNAAGESGNSNEVSFTISIPPPGAPKNLIKQ